MIIAFILFVAVVALVLVPLASENENADMVQKQQWNSDALLVDDRLQKDDPIFMIVSHGYMESGYYAATVFVLYNDGQYVTDYVVSDSEENYLDGTEGNKLAELLKKDYEAATSSEVAKLFTDNKKPSDIRAAYLKQYEIASTEMNNEVNMRNDGSSLEIYGVIYDDSLKSEVVCYYHESGNATKQIKDENGLSVLLWIMEQEIPQSEEE